MKKKSIDHTQLLLLKLLSTEDMYGYQIIKEIEQRSEFVFSFKEGTLYPVLKKLENSGYVTSYQAAANGRTRKYYRLTQSGRKELDRETAAWQAYSHGLSSVLGFVPG